MTQEECENNPREVVCGDCQQWLLDNPAIAERDFQAALQRAEQDSLAMRARWAAQDAAKQKGAA